MAHAQGRTPLDLVSQELKLGGQKLELAGHESNGSQLFCWGSGANYQLGTGEGVEGFIKGNVSPDDIPSGLL